MWPARSRSSSTGPELKIRGRTDLIYNRSAGCLMVKSAHSDLEEGISDRMPVERDPAKSTELANNLG